jgi:spore coat protein F
MPYKNHLAWHETLEIHELVAFQVIGLFKLKKQLEKYPNKIFKPYI